jgi:outer membrane protein OmpA-like peptidoglycan-associated protein
MGENEEATLVALKVVREELTDPTIQEHRGRIVKTMGDGLLVEFASVVDAVLCGVEIQREMAVRNQGISADRRIAFRIGINLGDIIIDQSDIFGDGVNIAARLEALAEPGGICISQVVRDQVHGKLDVTFVDQGDRQLKNITRPVRIFRIRFSENATIKPETLPDPPIGDPTNGEDKTKELDHSHDRLYIRHVSSFRFLTVVIFVIALLSVLYLSIDRLRLGERNYSNVVSQPGGEQSSLRPDVPGPADAPLTTLPVNSSLAADQAARSTIIGDPVFFERNQVVLSGSANAVIERQAEFLKDNPAITVTVEGHCSEEEGAREGPSVLAQLRANQVRNALKERGVAGARIHTIGYGDAKSAINGAEEAAQAQNRRVVVKRD